MYPQMAIAWLVVGITSAATVFAAGEVSQPATLQVRGILQPFVEITLRSAIDARIKTVNAVPGQIVDAGQVLVELDVSNLDRDLAQAAAGLDQATAENALAHAGAERVEKAEVRLRTDLGLARSLLNRSVAPTAEPGRRKGLSVRPVMRAPLREQADERLAVVESETDKTLLSVRMKRSMMEILQENIELLESQAKVAQRTAEDVLSRYATVTAPAVATVSGCAVKPHERVSVGQPILTLVDAKRVKALLWIPVHQIDFVRRGASVLVRAEASREAPYRGAVSWISVEKHLRTGQYLAEVVLENEDGHLRPGMLVDATIDL